MSFGLEKYMERYSSDRPHLSEFPDDIGSIVHVGLQGLTLSLQFCPDLLLTTLPLLRLLRQPRFALLEASNYVLADLNVSE